ncbi:hypothetical protein SLS58_005885 [Diplodia intermedia]|uniref:Fungal N-terminal domain-containing protein n=1 Tax=Diplodia intermedia TaxID=856260 RepID=A0ABR3TPG1_9PEZI
MAGILNIGDILMLSQLAWKIGRAFTAGRKSAPAEFLEVETEVSGLANALKMLAETLFADNSGESAAAGCADRRFSEDAEGRLGREVGGTGEGIREEGSGMLARASAETRGGVEVILQSCRQTLRDLESLVEQYQVIRKHRTGGGFSIERSWSDLVLSAYKKMLWTAEGGNIQALRNMLHMHTSTITLTMQALQSRSLSRLEETVHPMAEKVDEIHSAVTGDLSDKIQDVHAIVMALAGASSSPSLNPRDSHASDLPVWDSPLLEPMPESLRIGYYSRMSVASQQQLQQRSPDIAPLGGGGSYPYARRRHSSRRESDTSTAPSLSETSDRRSSGGTFSTMPATTVAAAAAAAATRTTAMSPGSPGPPSRCPSTAAHWRIEEAADEGESDQQHHSVSPQSLPQQRQQQQRRTDSRLSFTSSTLPSPAIPPDPDLDAGLRRLSLGPAAVTADVEKILLERSMTTRSQQDAFEKEAFRDSAILCELVYGAKPIKVEKTTWVNYVFEDVKSGTLFQNELMGRILVGVFKTEKTLRVHEGFSGVLTYQEQMCGMENLRLWANPASGGVLAMIHFSAQFRPGYLAFYLNSSNCPVRVKDEGGKEVKIKGLKIPIDRNRAGIGGRRGSESGKVEGKKWITGARVEFASDVEKLLFLEKVKEVQQTMILLPDI